MPADIPEEYEGIIELIEHYINLRHSLIIGTVLSYNSAKQTATVQPVTRGRRLNSDTGEIESYKFDIMNNVPVAVFGNPTFADTHPIPVGSSVIVTFCERSIDEFMLTGNKDHETQSMRRSDINDGIIIGFINPFVAPLTEVDPVARVISGALIKLGSVSASQGLMTQALQTALKAFASTLMGSADSTVVTAATTLNTVLETPLYTINVKV